jgi:dienelactone hydrolase
MATLQDDERISMETGLKQFLNIHPVVTISLIMALLLPLPVYAQNAPCSQVMVMQQGQSVAAIAASIFGTQDAVADIIAATNAQARVDDSYTMITDPNLVEVGWKLCIPAQSKPAQIESAQNEGGPQIRRTVANGTTAMHRAAIAGKRQLATIPLEENTVLLETLLSERLRSQSTQGENALHPLSIEYLRAQEYPPRSLSQVEGLLSEGDTYSEFLVSYESEGLTLYAAMSVPKGEKPSSGWPVVIFVHGYVEPASYSPTARYTEYMKAIASSGYIVLRPDLRGHGNSEGNAFGAYGDPGYTIDLLNALEAIKTYPDADPQRIGIWGHSMGGYLAARVMVVSDDIQAGVIWAGVVAPYAELLAVWDPSLSTLAEGELPIHQVLVDAYGTPQENPEFWHQLSANSYAAEISGPVQLHHGTADTDVPVSFSDRFYADLIAAGQTAEYYQYGGDDHNISAGFEDAMRRSLEFLDTYVKQLTPTPAQQQAASPAP